LTDTSKGKTVSVIGLGLMGSALAKAFLANNHKVTVWNRSSIKCRPLAEAGAKVASSVGEAVDASDTVVLCLLDYSTSDALLHAPDVTAKLKDKVIVQLATGTPREAREGEAWAKERGIHYLDGAIMSYPKGIGTPDCTILYAGPEEVFEAHRDLLLSLGGNTLFVGERISTACVLDSSLLSFYYGTTMGFLQGAALCEAEGVSLEDYFANASAVLPVVADTMQLSVGMIQKGRYEGSEGALVTHAAALDHIGQLIQETGVNRAFSDCLSKYFTSAIAAGHGRDELPAVFEAFRSRRGIA
jgi:3-hydroxyisobutyrate dehydrogenase-like beta-hydroxyacid dehydrogenase